MIFDLFPYPIPYRTFIWRWTNREVVDSLQKGTVIIFINRGRGTNTETEVIDCLQKGTVTIVS